MAGLVCPVLGTKCPISIQKDKEMKGSKKGKNELRISCIGIGVMLELTYSNRQQEFFFSEFSV